MAAAAWVLGGVMTQLQSGMNATGDAGGLGAVSPGISEALVLLCGLPALLLIGIGVATIFRLYCYRRWVFLVADDAPLPEQLQPETSGR